MNQTTADLKPADAVAQTWVDSTPHALQPYLRLMRLDRPIGIWLIFWPCVFGLVLGAIASERPFAGWHDLYMLLLFGAGSIVMRGAGCTYNDIVDRDIDASVARTRGRPIPSGAVSVRPDPGRRLTGRGAYVHPRTDCLALAERRRAFARSLRRPGPLDLEPLRAALGVQGAQG